MNAHQRRTRVRYIKRRNIKTHPVGSAWIWDTYFKREGEKVLHCKVTGHRRRMIQCHVEALEHPLRYIHPAQLKKLESQ